MNDLIFFLRIIGFVFIYCIFICVYWVFRESFGKFIDKIFSFSYLREGGSYKYTNGDKELSSEGFIVTIFFLFAIMSLLVLVIFEFNLVILAVVLPVLFPACLLFLRVNTFSDDNILLETGMGYNFKFSYVLSLFASVGFLMIFPLFFGAEEPLYFFVVVFVLALAGALVPMIPDYINKLLPYDIRSEKGEKLLIAITLLLVITLWVFVFAYFISTGASPSELMPARFGGE